MSFKKATRKQAKLKIALVGPTGSGKTYSALMMAKGMGGRVAVIDTERGSASLYSHLVDFDVNELSEFAPEVYMEAIHEAVKQGYEVLVIDSLSHEWAATKDFVSKISANMKSEWSAWSKGTPRHQALIDTILQAPIHIICTMRAKTEWGSEKDEKTGKIKPIKLGMGPDQRSGVEYEFTTIFNLSDTHIAQTEKDRTGIFSNFAEPITEATGERYRVWLERGEENPAYRKASEEKKLRVFALLDQLNLVYEDELVAARMQELTQKPSINLWTESDAQKVIQALEQRLNAVQALGETRNIVAA